MTYPFDQVAAFAGANSELAQKFFDIARASGERQAKIGAEVVNTITDQAKNLKPGVPAFFTPVGFTDVFREAEQSRQAAIADTRAAVEAWQAKIRDLFSTEEGQKQATSAFQTWSQFFLTPLTAAVETAKPANVTPAKTRTADAAAA